LNANHIASRTRIRFGVVGLGAIGVVHAENLAGRVPGASLLWVADTRAEAVDQAVHRFGVRGTTDSTELLAASDVDAVVIATPASSHSTLVEEAAQAGKHVLCEKPLAQDENEALRAIGAADSADVRLQVGFQRRFDAEFEATASRIRAGELGIPYQYQASMRDMSPPSEDEFGRESIMLSALCHDFDTARWLVGEIGEVTAFGADASGPPFSATREPDSVFVVVRFEGGAIGLLESSCVAGYGFECRVEVMGSEATVRIGYSAPGQSEWLTRGGSRTAYPATFLQRFETAYIKELEAFARAIRTDEPLRVTGVDGLLATQLCLAAVRSLREGHPIRIQTTGDQAAPADAQASS